MAALDEPLTAAALQAACEGKTHSLKGLDVAAVTADLAKLSPAEAAALAARMDALRPSIDVDAAARSLLDPLARTRSLADAGDALTVDAAYAIQKRCRQLREAGGERIVGHKVGCASEAVRASLGVGAPVRGDLWEREQRVDGAVVALARFADLAVEGELCLELFATSGAVEDWLCVYAPVIELHHVYRNCARPQRAAEIVAKNALHAGVVCGVGWSKPTRLGDVPLDVELKVTIDGVLRDVATLGGLDVGGARGVAGTVRWLADALAADGAGLRPGSRVLAATPGALIPLAAVDKEVVVSFGSQVVSMAVGDDDAADDAPNPRAETEASGHMAWGDAT